jgi:serine/threonine-protein kinase RsbT
MSPRRTVRVAGDADVAAAARAAREEAERCGLSGVEAQHVATAVSEVARNAVKYAGGCDVELVPAERSGRRGVSVTVRDGGPGIDDVAAALRDGVSTGGSLGLGLPGARRLMDDFVIATGPAGTEVTMARWEGGLLATHVPAACTLRAGTGGVAVAQPFRNGLLLGLAAGARAGDVVREWRTRPWHAPARLAEDCRAQLDPGERIGLALASVSALDGRLAWLRAGAVGCVLLRAASERGGEATAAGEASGRASDAARRQPVARPPAEAGTASGRGGIVVLPPAAAALGRGVGGPPRAATVDVRRDDVLVMAAAPLDAPALAALAASGGAAPGAPALLTARFERGALEPRRPTEGVREAR